MTSDITLFGMLLKVNVVESDANQTSDFNQIGTKLSLAIYHGPKYRSIKIKDRNHISIHVLSSLSFHIYMYFLPSAMRVTSQRILSFLSLLSPCRIFMPCSGRSSTRYTSLAGLSWLSSAILSSNRILLALECFTWLTGIGHYLFFLLSLLKKIKKHIALAFHSILLFFTYLISNRDIQLILIFTSQGIVISYLSTIPWQNRYLKVGLEDARDTRLFLSVNQSERFFPSEFGDYTNFQFNEDHVLLTQREIVCNWFHMMSVEPIK